MIRIRKVSGRVTHSAIGEVRVDGLPVKMSAPRGGSSARTVLGEHNDMSSPPAGPHRERDRALREER